MAFLTFVVIYLILVYYKTHTFLILISNSFLSIIVFVNKTILLLVVCYIFLICTNTSFVSLFSLCYHYICFIFINNLVDKLVSYTKIICLF